jgi:hypothetical protein
VDSKAIFALTQSILAVIIVIGGGVLLAVTTVEPTAIVGVVGLVVGYFFGSSVNPSLARPNNNGMGGRGK